MRNEITDEYRQGMGVREENRTYDMACSEKEHEIPQMNVKTNRNRKIAVLEEVWKSAKKTVERKYSFQ